MHIAERNFFEADKRTKAESFSRLFGAARRFHRHRTSLDTYAELVGAVADALWAHRNKAHPAQSLATTLSTFYNHVCKVRVATQAGVDIGGYIVLDGELKALWCDEAGWGTVLVQSAVDDGAVRLQCFDGYLVRLYSQFDFKIVKREPNWVHGEPDLVYMERV